MNHKTQRLSIIRKIIRSEFICSQEELIKRLEECGVTITQSTLSRMGGKTKRAMLSDGNWLGSLAMSAS